MEQGPKSSFVEIISIIFGVWWNESWPVAKAPVCNCNMSTQYG